MRLCSIASGSSGNCIYVGSDNTHLLIDTGISKKRIDAGLFSEFAGCGTRRDGRNGNPQKAGTGYGL